MVEASKRGAAAVRIRESRVHLVSWLRQRKPDDLAVGLALVRSSGRFSGSGTVVVLNFRALQAGQSELKKS